MTTLLGCGQIAPTRSRGTPWAGDKGELAPLRAKAETDPQGALPILGALGLGLAESPQRARGGEDAEEEDPWVPQPNPVSSEVVDCRTALLCVFIDMVPMV